MRYFAFHFQDLSLQYSAPNVHSFKFLGFELYKLPLISEEAFYFDL